MSGRKVLITGATGFIGRNLVKYIDNNLHDWIPLQSSSDDDLTIPYLAKELVNDYKPDAIIHLAAISNPAYEDKTRMWNVNVDGTHNLLKACQPETRFILASSINIYGNPYYPHTESPVDMYGATKLAAESLVNVFNKQNGIKGSSLRLCGVLGPNMTHGFLHKMIENFTQTGKVIVYGKNGVNKPFLHIDDVCKAFCLALKNDKFDKLIIANKDTINTLDVAKKIAGIYNIATIDKHMNNQIGYDCHVAKLILDWERTYTSSEVVNKVLEGE